MCNTYIHLIEKTPTLKFRSVGPGMKKTLERVLKLLFEKAIEIMLKKKNKSDLRKKMVFKCYLYKLISIKIYLISSIYSQNRFLNLSF